MLQSVHTVIVGKQAPASYTDVDSLNEGDIALFDQDRALITTAAAAADATSLYVGVAKPKITVTLPDGTTTERANIEYSNEIKKDGHPFAVIGEYEAPENQVVTIDLTSATISPGNRYVLRILYKDLGEYKLQFTHTYEVFAPSSDADELATLIVEKVNRHMNRRVNAANTSGVITLTAMDKTDNEGVYSINYYSIVDMAVSLYTTIPGALLSNQPDPVFGATIETTTVGNPGKGFWKQVRDAEVRYNGYKGHVFIDAYPMIAQKLNVVENTEYDYAIIKSDNHYLSNDNQYIKTTPLTVEVYCPEMEGSIVATGIETFIAA